MPLVLTTGIERQKKLIHDEGFILRRCCQWGWEKLVAIEMIWITTYPITRNMSIPVLTGFEFPAWRMFTASTRSQMEDCGVQNRCCLHQGETDAIARFIFSQWRLEAHFIYHQLDSPRSSSLSTILNIPCSVFFTNEAFSSWLNRGSNKKRGEENDKP